jgi:hypothetical protein
MISSILTCANNALLWSGGLASARAKFAEPAKPAAEQRVEVISAAAQRPESAEERQAENSVLKNFEKSLSERLRVTGLTGPESARKISELTKEASERVREVQREHGASEANRLMAEVLTQAFGENPGGSAAQALSAFSAVKSARDPERRDRETVQKSKKETEKTAAAAPPAKEAGEAEAEPAGDEPSAALSVLKAAGELERGGPGAGSLAAPELLSRVQEVKSEIQRQKPPERLFAGPGAEPAEDPSASSQKGAHSARQLFAAACQSPPPRSGSLLSVTV